MRFTDGLWIHKIFPFFMFKFHRHISYFATRMLECSCLYVWKWSVRGWYYHVASHPNTRSRFYGSVCNHRPICEVLTCSAALITEPLTFLILSDMNVLCGDRQGGWTKWTCRTIWFSCNFWLGTDDYWQNPINCQGGTSYNNFRNIVDIREFVSDFPDFLQQN